MLASKLKRFFVQETPSFPINRRLRYLFFGMGLVALGLGYVSEVTIGSEGQALAGIICFISLIAACSKNPRAINWRTVWVGLALQVLLGLLVLRFEVHGHRPIYSFFEAIAGLVRRFLECSDAGARFLFGGLADPKLAPGGFIFAVRVLPTIIFASTFFSILNHVGVTQFVVKQLARVMQLLMRTSGAETLSVAANVFVGQTEAPLLIRSFVPRMTESELLTMMVGGFAHVSGAMMAVYIGYGADPVAILTTSVMAAPASLYLGKIMLPETSVPETTGDLKAILKGPVENANILDALATGATTGMKMALNIAAMLIAFLAILAVVDALLGAIKPALLSTGLQSDTLSFLPDNLSLSGIFSWLFSPIAMLIGTPRADVAAMADLLGGKLVINEHFAYLKLTGKLPWAYHGELSTKASVLAAFALTGFANLTSVGVQIGGIGAIAPDRRADLSRLGMRALFVGYTVTLVNTCIAALL